MTILSLVFFHYPLLWALLFCSFFFYYLVLRNKSRAKTFVNFNIATVLLLFSLFEGVFCLKEAREAGRAPFIKLERVYELEKDDILGTRLIKDSSRQARKYVDGKLIYDVTITVDHHGLRISPACKSNCDSAILFFGDSFTFGEGVNDSETMPYQCGLLLNRKYRVYNFAVHGYGPHQMLSAIEHGLVASVAGPNISRIVYQCIYPEHIKRLKGYREWDAHGPQYKLDQNNEPKYCGHFDDKKCYLNFLSGYSAFYRKILAYEMPLSVNDKMLFIAVILKSRQLLREKSPAAEFHVIVWDWSEGKDKWVFDELKKKGEYFIHYIEDILPGRSKTNLKYKISSYDKHPNAKAYSFIAKYVVRTNSREVIEMQYFVKYKNIKM